MERKGHESVQDGTDRAVIYTVLRDVLRQWPVILCFACSAALLAAVIQQWRYTPSYTTQTTFYVTQKGYSGNVYDNESSAQVMAEHFEQILNSSILQKKVAQEIGMPEFAGSASAEAIEQTNLLTLRVTANSPELCFKLIRSILKNYTLVSDYMTGDAKLEILKAPQIPMAPDHPFSKYEVMRKGFLGMAVFWILIFAGQSWMQDTIRTEYELEQKLETRLIGTLWHERGKKRKKEIRMDDPLVSFRYTESVRKMTQRVRRQMDEWQAQTLLVTSVLPKEGKTTVAENLAFALAAQKERVFLLNADFRRPEAGYLANEEGHLKTENFRKLLENLKKENDYVIIDTPPLQGNADTEEMAQIADASLLVVAQHRARTKDLNVALDLLNAQEKKNIGCVCNDMHAEPVGIWSHYASSYNGSYGRYGGRI